MRPADDRCISLKRICLQFSGSVSWSSGFRHAVVALPVGCVASSTVRSRVVDKYRIDLMWRPTRLTTRLRVHDILRAITRVRRFVSGELSPISLWFREWDGPSYYPSRIGSGHRDWSSCHYPATYARVGGHNAAVIGDKVRSTYVRDLSNAPRFNNSIPTRRYLSRVDEHSYYQFTKLLNYLQIFFLILALCL